MFNWDISLYSVSRFFRQPPRRSPLHLFSFLQWQLMFDSTFYGQQSSTIEQENRPEKRNSFHANKNLQSTLQAIFTPVLYPVFSVASIECPDSATLTGRNT